MLGESHYVFADEPDGGGGRFGALAVLYDNATKDYMNALGIESGWHCLEVGAGGGSIARWLATRVATGRVVATDLDVSNLRGSAGPNLDVWQHDITSDPLPAGAFDLVHARLLLMHLPDPAAAMARLVAALRPGGWLLVEEFDAPPVDFVDSAVSAPKTSLAFRKVMECAGVDIHFGRRLPEMMRRYGLVSIGAEARTALWTAYGPGTRLMRANYLGLKQAILDTGLVDPAVIDADLARLDDPEFVMLSPMMWTAWGQCGDGN